MSRAKSKISKKPSKKSAPRRSRPPEKTVALFDVAMAKEGDWYAFKTPNVIAYLVPEGKGWFGHVTIKLDKKANKVCHIDTLPLLSSTPKMASKRLEKLLIQVDQALVLFDLKSQRKSTA